MNLNTCCTARSFEDPAWMEMYNLLHQNLKVLSKDSADHIEPSIFNEYRNSIWKTDPDSTGKTFCAPANVKETHKIWEYTQILSCLKKGLGEFEEKRILSLGAGVESPLWALSLKKAAVIATDMYFQRRYWHRNQVPYIKKNPDVFNPYTIATPVTFKHLNLRFRSIHDHFTWHGLGFFDAIYSISSLEHVHGTQKRRKMQDRKIIDKKHGMFRKIAGKIKSGGVLVFTTELITSFTELRRLDFYTREELENITAVLEKEGVRLMDPLDWSAMHECEIATRGTPGAFHTAICLAFKKK